ncbi:TraU family protein [Azospirillum sp. sgz302134]
MTVRALAGAFALALALLTGAAALAEPQAQKPTCPNAGLLSGRIISSLCWTCMFPIKVMGVPLMNMSGSGTPSKSSDQAVCVCPSKDGKPKAGLGFGMWMPVRLVELVRTPGCSTALGGIILPLGDMRMQGTRGEGVYDSGDKGFFHYHTYSFPILFMLDLFIDGMCFADGMLDMDLVFTSEFDPTWSEDELSFFMFPENAAIANPLAIAACMVDTAAATVGEPVDSLFWCAGGWGMLYPMAGRHDAPGSLAKNTSLLAARSLAIAHRRGLAWRSMGSDVMCGGAIDPLMTKSMYRFSMFFPVTQATTTKRTVEAVPGSENSGGTAQQAEQSGSGKEISVPGSHVLGYPSMLWGDWRSIPAIGEDALYVIYRWVDCCIGIVGG